MDGREYGLRGVHGFRRELRGEYEHYRAYHGQTYRGPGLLLFIGHKQSKLGK